MVDVNVTTQSKGSEKQVFKDRELKKNKFATNWEVKERVERSMVETYNICKQLICHQTYKIL
jgi:hypothetical protein